MLDDVTVECYLCWDRAAARIVARGVAHSGNPQQCRIWHYDLLVPEFVTKEAHLLEAAKETARLGLLEGYANRRGAQNARTV